jgi:addiction module HigA family antidote
MSRNPDRCPTHPGALLREDLIPAMGKTTAEIAQMLGISRKHLHDVMAERKRVSAEMAGHLAKLFGNEALFWIRMQDACDTYSAWKGVGISDFPTFNAGK